MSDEKPTQPAEQGERKETPSKAPAGARATRGAAGSKRGRAVPAGVRKTAGGARPTRDGAAAQAKSAESGAGASKPAEQQAKAILTLKKFSPVYIVKSSVVDDICGMCRNNLDQVCNDCFTHHNTDCPVVQGKCLHRFHLHCIQGWLKKSRLCPHGGCGARWESM